jgi:hypothetical protein
MADLQTHRRRYLILLLLICPVAAFVLTPHPPDFSVGKRARKLVPITDWFNSPLNGDLAYQWSTPDQIVVMHVRGRVTVVNVANGEEQPLQRLNDAFRRRPALESLSRVIPNWVLSPDGRSILTYTFVNGRAEWVAASIDGSRVVEAPTPTLIDPVAFWERDSRGFVQLAFRESTGYARRFRLDGPNPPASTPIGSDPRDYRIDLPHFQFEDPYMPLGEFAPGRLLIANFGGRSGVRFMVVDLRRPGRPEPVDVDVPSGAVVREIELSPDGRRLGWILDFAVGSMDPSLRSLPFVPVGPRHGNSEVWVSNRNGSGMHPVATPGVEPNRSGPFNLRWTPDSKNVTFVYSGALYSAPAG